MVYGKFTSGRVSNPWMWTAHDCAHHHFRRYIKGQLGWLFRAADYRVQVHSYFNSLLFPPSR